MRKNQNINQTTRTVCKKGYTKWKKYRMYGTAFFMALAMTATPIVGDINASCGIQVVHAAEVIIPNGSYAFLTHDDGTKTMNVLFASTEEAKAQIGIDNFDYEKNEIWIVTNQGNGYVTIAPSHCPQLVLNALFANKTPGDLVTLHRFTPGDAASLWKPIKNADGSYTFQNKATGLVLDCRNGSYEIGNNILNWTKNGYLRAQGWYLENLSNQTASTELSDGLYAVLMNYDDSKGINVLFASTEEDKAQIGVDNFDYENNELWIITNRGDGYVTLAPKHCPELVINALLANKTPGDLVTLHRWTEGDEASLWKPIQNVDGSYTFENKATGLVLDCRNGSYEIGNKILNWTKNGYLQAQGFDLQKIGDAANVESTISKERQAALAKAKQMVEVTWTAPCDFPTWLSSKGVSNTVVATDGTRSNYFIKGKTYQGIPYSMVNHSYDDVKWVNLLQKGITKSKMSGTYYSKYSKKTTALGIDCSYFVYTAFKSANTGYNISYQTTSAMLNSKYYTKKNLSDIKPGDIALKNGHVRLYVGRDGEYYGFYEANAGDSKCTYNVYSASSLQKDGYKIYKFNGFSD